MTNRVVFDPVEGPTMGLCRIGRPRAWMLVGSLLSEEAISVGFSRTLIMNKKYLVRGKRVRRGEYAGAAWTLGEVLIGSMRPPAVALGSPAGTALGKP